jgi:hypothetical protein
MAGTFQLDRFLPLPTRAELSQLGKVGTDDYRRDMRHRVSLREIEGTSEIKEWADGNRAALRFTGNAVRQSHWQRALASRPLGCVKRSYEYIGTEGTKFGGDATLGINLQVEERGRDGGTGAERKQNDE